MNYAFYTVYRDCDGCDCTANGLSSKVTRAYMFYDCTRDEAIEWCKQHNVKAELQFFLNKRDLWGEDHSYAEPLIKPYGLQMFGGNFLYTSNSASFKFKGETVTRPIKIHDRFESQEVYNAMSI